MATYGGGGCDWIIWVGWLGWMDSGFRVGSIVSSGLGVDVGLKCGSVAVF